MTEQTKELSIIDLYAQERHLTRDDLVIVLMKTIMPKDKSGNDLATKADLIGFLQICSRFDLDPWAKEIYCVVIRGRLTTIISIDGFAKIANRHPEYDGCEFDYEQDTDGRFLSVTCTMYRKDRARPTRVTEFMSDCYKPDSEAWKQSPARMLRHRAFIQAVRLTFPGAGMMDEENQGEVIDITPTPTAPEAPKTTTPKAPARKGPPPAQRTGQAPVDERQSFRSFDDDAGKQQQRKDGPDEQPSQPATEPAGEDKKSGVAEQTAAKSKTPPRAANTQQEPERAQREAQKGHDRPDVETIVNDLYDRLGEAKGQAQLLEIWSDINPAAALEHLDKAEMERWLGYLQKRFDKLDKGFADKGAK